MLSEWQPIETAPKEVKVIVWSQAIVCPCIAYRIEGQWADSEGDWDLRDDEQPTHWMPLPEPPT